MTHQRWSKGKANVTVTVAANITTAMKKDQFVATQKNKHAAVYFHAEYRSGEEQLQNLPCNWRC